MRKLFLLMVLCLFMTVACGKKNDDQLKQAVLKYNSLLAEGYRLQEMNILQQASTIDQAAKVYYHMAALGEGNVAMDSFLRSIEFLEVRQTEPHEARLITKESWNYKYINMTTRKAGDEYIVNYTAQYHLKEENDKWLVAGVSILESDRMTEDDNLPFFKRPAKTR